MTSHAPPAPASADSPHSRALAPTWATLVLTWVNNLGAATALIGVYFITVSKYGFTGTQNLGLGLLQGITYIAGALSAGPGMRLVQRATGFSTRTSLLGVHLLMFAVCAVPVVFDAPWAIWLLVGVYSPLSGWLWPTIESYLSAGRNGAALRRATGRFNISWASSQVLVFWLLAPFVKDVHWALWAIAGFGLSHLLCAPVIAAIPPEPASGPHDGSHPHTADERARYVRLLAAFRLSIVLSYILYSALNPLLPLRVRELHVLAQWATPMASAWMIARVVTFAFMQQWHGWHGRRTALIGGLLPLVGGFAGCLVAPTPTALVFALACFGIGLGVIYTAALYYAMEVGHAGVDAGGTHEALIGAGFSIGPVAGLIAQQGLTGPEPAINPNLAVLIVAGVVVAAVLTLVVRAAIRPLPR